MTSLLQFQSLTLSTLASSPSVDNALTINVITDICCGGLWNVCKNKGSAHRASLEQFITICCGGLGNVWITRRMPSAHRKLRTIYVRKTRLWKKKKKNRRKHKRKLLYFTLEGHVLDSGVVDVQVQQAGVGRSSSHQLHQSLKAAKLDNAHSKHFFFFFFCVPL